jgi:hypothetical protein
LSWGPNHRTRGHQESSRGIPAEVELLLSLLLRRFIQTFRLRRALPVGLSRRRGNSLNSFDRVLPTGSALAKNAGRERKFSRKLAERLGFSALDRVIIINCDDLGSSRSANLAVERALRSGIASSATLMVPCPWAQVASEVCRDLDIGIHLTLTSEYPAYRWPSLTGGRSLNDKRRLSSKDDTGSVGPGRSARDRTGMQSSNRSSASVGRRCDPSGLSYGHAAARPALFRRLHAAGEKAIGCRCGLRRPSVFQFPLSYISGATLDRQGIVTTDRFIAPPWGEPASGGLDRTYPESFEEGSPKSCSIPVDDGEELRAYDTEYADLRVADAQCLTDASLRALIASQNIRQISYRPLRDAMRNAT